MNYSPDSPKESPKEILVSACLKMSKEDIMSHGLLNIKQ